MFSGIRKIIFGVILAVLLILLQVFSSSCAGFAVSFSRGGLIPNFTFSADYKYVSPYAYIEGYRFYVYDYGYDPYVIYLGVPYHITIYGDGRVWAPRALVVLLD